jgi:hypothetical protein
LEHIAAKRLEPVTQSVDPYEKDKEQGEDHERTNERMVRERLEARLLCASGSHDW